MATSYKTQVLTQADFLITMLSEQNRGVSAWPDFEQLFLNSQAKFVTCGSKVGQKRVACDL